MRAPWLEIDRCALQLAEGGGGFAMELATTDGQQLRLAFPAWILHPLLRVLPHLDAALHQGADDHEPGRAAPLRAYAVREWTLARAASQPLQLALHLRDERQIDGAYAFSLDAAQALHRELGRALDEAHGRTAAYAG
jgi:hypothetical protein